MKLSQWLMDLGYRQFRMPWETGLREELVGLVESRRIAPCRAIDLGCGTGSNGVYCLVCHGEEGAGAPLTAVALKDAA